MLLARERGAPGLIDAERCRQLQHYPLRLKSGELRIGQMLREENLELACEQLIPFARWITPAVMPKHFDTRFYLARMPAAQAELAVHDGREAVESTWIRPIDAIARAATGELVII